jgi:hypothetical protein
VSAPSPHYRARPRHHRSTATSPRPRSRQPPAPRPGPLYTAPHARRRPGARVRLADDPRVALRLRRLRGGPALGRRRPAGHRRHAHDPLPAPHAAPQALLRPTARRPRPRRGPRRGGLGRAPCPRRLGVRRPGRRRHPPLPLLHPQDRCAARGGRARLPRRPVSVPAVEVLSRALGGASGALKPGHAEPHRAGTLPQQYQARYVSVNVLCSCSSSNAASYAPPHHPQATTSTRATVTTSGSTPW